MIGARPVVLYHGKPVDCFVAALFCEGEWDISRRPTVLQIPEQALRDIIIFQGALQGGRPKAILFKRVPCKAPENPRTSGTAAPP